MAVTMTMIERTTTADQLLQMLDLGRCELVRGELVTIPPAGFEHGDIAGNVFVALKNFVQQHRLGVVTIAETGFRIESGPDTVRAPDAAFVRAERVPSPRPQGFYPGAPDLAVEVLSPDDRASEVNDKVQQWLDAGCRVVWVVDPKTRSVTVYRGLEQVEVLRASDALSGGDVLPGFSIRVEEVFA